MATYEPNSDKYKSMLQMFGVRYYDEQISVKTIREKCPFLKEVRNQGHVDSSSYFACLECICATYYMVEKIQINLSVKHAIDRLGDVLKAKYPEKEFENDCPFFTPIQQLFFYVLYGDGVYDAWLEYPYVLDKANDTLLKENTFDQSVLTNLKKYKIEDFEFTQSLVLAEEWLAEGPIVASHRVHEDFHVFRGEGVYMAKEVDKMERKVRTKKFKKDQVGHTVLLIGKGVVREVDENGNKKLVKYFMAKNSFGETWGVQGFGKMEREVFFVFGRPLKVRPVD